jgi:NAD(P)-dependent dehydrogenase (short-subunit alcohol dehydrogenase family)
MSVSDAVRDASLGLREGDAVAFLLSADASYITGQGISVNGGRAMVP